MNYGRNSVTSLIISLICCIFIACAVYLFDTKGYVLTPADYTITSISKSYGYGHKPFNYLVDIAYEKDGINYKSRCYIKKDKYNILKNYLDNQREDDAKNFLGDIKVYKNMRFMILKDVKINN